jgi:hypothetical protein
MIYEQNIFQKTSFIYTLSSTGLDILLMISILCVTLHIYKSPFSSQHKLACEIRMLSSFLLNLRITLPFFAISFSSFAGNPIHVLDVALLSSFNKSLKGSVNVLHCTFCCILFNRIIINKIHDIF